MRLPENQTSPAISTDHAELVAVREQLIAMDRALRAERFARTTLAFSAEAEISGLRRRLELPPPAADAGQAWHNFKLAIAAVMAVAVLAVLSRTSQNIQPPPAALQAVTSGGAKLPQMGSALETYALSRLSAAVGAVPALAMPSVLSRANEYLASTGEQACSVESARGEAALVVASFGDDKPLLAALSRCAQAVEYLTQRPRR